VLCVTSSGGPPGAVPFSYLVVLFRYEGCDTHWHRLDGITFGEPTLWPGGAAGRGVAGEVTVQVASRIWDYLSVVTSGGGGA